MARAAWIVDSNRIASKIRTASATLDPELINWTSNPTRTCPNCQHVIDNTEVAQEWPGLPRGVKFDPTDQEIIWHLLGKAGVENLKPHPFLDEFIPTVNEDDGICYTHPRNLPGVKQDGSVSHFFHRAIKAYNTGTRKRRKIHGASSGDVRWHKTGRTKPVLLNGIQKGCKKIMVLYLSPTGGGKPEKTNWVMHQYHLGIEEDEKDGEYVISKVFYQQLQIKQSDRNEGDGLEDDAMVVKVDPVTPKSVTPEPPHVERRPIDCATISIAQNNEAVDMEEQFGSPLNEQPMFPLNEQEPMFPLNEQQPIPPLMEQPISPPNEETDCADLSLAEGFAEIEEEEKVDHDNNDNDDNEANGEERKWWDSESQYMLDSQQLVEALSLCDEFLQSQSSQQSPKRDGNKNVQGKNKARLSDYAQLGPEHLKKDLEECQNLVLDPANLELDTPPSDFRLSQLEFGSQDSFISWGGSKAFDAGDQDSSK